jgi:hypothetical protein
MVFHFVWLVVSIITTKTTTMEEEEEESLQPCPKAHKHNNLVYVSQIMGEGRLVGRSWDGWVGVLFRKKIILLFFH